jgi:O-methyltransferase
MIALLKSRDHEFGDYLEFGVSRGTSMACVFHALQRSELHQVRLIGFDSFAGMPPEAETQGWRQGAYASTLRATRRYLREHDVDLRRLQLVEGWFKDTLKDATARKLALRKASLIMIDCDIYSASKQALRFSERFIVDTAMIIFDDWGSRADHGKVGQREAFAEFLAEFPDISAEPFEEVYRPASRIFLVRRTKDYRR